MSNIRSRMLQIETGIFKLSSKGSLFSQNRKGSLDIFKWQRRQIFSGTATNSDNRNSDRGSFATPIGAFLLNFDDLVFSSPTITKSTSDTFLSKSIKSRQVSIPDTILAWANGTNHQRCLYLLLSLSLMFHERLFIKSCIAWSTASNIVESQPFCLPAITRSLLGVYLRDS